MLDATTLTPGTPVIHRDGEYGFISRVTPSKTRSFTLGTGRMVPVANEVEVCFEKRLTVVPDNIAEPWIQRAGHLPAIPVEEIEARRQAALNYQNDQRDIATRKREEYDAQAAAFRLVAAEKMPPWAKAVIVAELVEDKSDSMSDYFNSVTRRTVIIGFSTHARDLFPELRKAALNFPETADLFDAPASAENREKYSMGGGYYLKVGSRHGSGWRVSKRKLYNGANDIPVGDWALSAPIQAPAIVATPAPSCDASSGMTIEKHVHSKHGFDMWIVVLTDRVERATFDALLTSAKAARGWYSRQWGATPAGFAFKDESAAATFAQEHAGTPPDASSVAQGIPLPLTPPNAPAPRTTHQAGTADKLRGLADKLQADIDHKLGDRLTNTPKRQREAASARHEGARLQRTQQALRALANHHDAGTVPDALRGISTKAAIYDLCRSKIDTSHSGYYDAGFDTNMPAVNSPAALAAWALLSAPDPEAVRAAELRAKIEKLQFVDIPGYFATPATLIDRMIYAADMPTTPCTVLEPSAGSAAILDRVSAAFPGYPLSVFERHTSLRAIIEAKGYQLAGNDFTESPASLLVDRVLMNPPFEKGQDIDHVRRAFEHLALGGRLVAIMSTGPFFREDAKARAFRAWFEALGGEREDIPAGTFKESGTGVATVMVTIDRDV